MKTREVIVLDFEDASVHIYKYVGKDQDIEDFIRKQGHNESNCQWMCADIIDLNIHNTCKCQIN